jgi:hypothetical protein
MVDYHVEGQGYAAAVLNTCNRAGISAVESSGKGNVKMSPF